MHKTKLQICLFLFVLMSFLFSQTSNAEKSIIRLATTTSTDNSGLLAALLPTYERSSNYSVHVIAVGTGKALRLIREGDVDVVLVHARSAEDKLIADGYGVSRKDVMYNDFLIVGDSSDPANIKGMSNAILAFQKIVQQKATFLSRGDESGTHKKELSLWREANVIPAGKWYRQAGQGMGKVLQMSGELLAYTLTDRGTWLAFQSNSPLKIMVQGDDRLFNPYGIIAINPNKFPDANHTGAMNLIDWITSEPAQLIIQNFKISGEVLFFPMALNSN